MRENDVPETDRRVFLAGVSRDKLQLQVAKQSQMLLSKTERRADPTTNLARKMMKKNNNHMV